MLRVAVSRRRTEDGDVPGTRGAPQGELHQASAAGGDTHTVHQPLHHRPQQDHQEIQHPRTGQSGAVILRLSPDAAAGRPRDTRR